MSCSPGGQRRRAVEARIANSLQGGLNFQQIHLCLGKLASCGLLCYYWFRRQVQACPSLPNTVWGLLVRNLFFIKTDGPGRTQKKGGGRCLGGIAAQQRRGILVCIDVSCKDCLLFQAHSRFLKGQTKKKLQAWFWLQTPSTRMEEG